MKSSTSARCRPRCDSVLTGWTPAESYSVFAALIEVERRPIFYLWTVFAPVILIFVISCAIFAVDIENLHDRIGIGLTALLACIAMQFTVSLTSRRFPI